LSDNTQRIIQTLFELLVRVHGFDGPESSDVVAVTIKDLVDQFQRLGVSASSPAIADVKLPREVIQYVEDGRNPDIYTREFVELVVKQNQLMNGKRRAFARFRDVLAQQMEARFPELKEEVRKVVEGTGG
ncbi:mediator complex, subunit Med10, partial [Trichophaea hybrida]